MESAGRGLGDIRNSDGQINPIIRLGGLLPAEQSTVTDSPGTATLTTGRPKQARLSSCVSINGHQRPCRGAKV